ncbi:MAG: hypothetical protein WKG00_01725 [Polyangiaceae bacterium]
MLRAAPPPAATPGPPPDDPTGFEERLVFDTGRIAVAPPAADRIAVDVHGEYQLRYRAHNDLRLQPPQLDPSANTLGLNQYVYHWLRITPRLRYRDKIQIVGQIDIPRGMIFGDTTQYVDRVRDSLSEERWYEVQPRYLYLEYQAPFGLFRIGQQGSHWGMGLLANDGDHPTLFGDYQRGSLVDRVLFATTPMGRGTPLTIAIAGDLVFEDNTADLIDGDDPDFDDDDDVGNRALQGVLAVLWRTKPAEIGIYGVLRKQDTERESVPGSASNASLTPFQDGLTVGVLDLSGKFNAPVGGAEAFVYGEFEWAFIFGSSNALRSAPGSVINARAERESERVRTFGGAVTLGAVKVTGTGKERFGRVVGEVEWGYASGDADPYDGTTRRFTFDPNHNVGLVLFDHVMAWKTARSATIAQDPRIVNRATPGLQLLPSKGGVFGATYLNPRVIVRPWHWMDLKAGAVIAQTTADLVDPYQAGALGSYRNYDGGDPERHDLGVELDAGVEGRIALDGVTTVQVGAEGGVLFTGHAFDDDAGNGLGKQYAGQLELGLQY